MIKEKIKSKVIENYTSSPNSTPSPTQPSTKTIVSLGVFIIVTFFLWLYSLDVFLRNKKNMPTVAVVVCIILFFLPNPITSLIIFSIVLFTSKNFIDTPGYYRPDLLGNNFFFF